MLHRWTKATDGNGSTVRVILFDYKAAFDYIDYTILVSKLKRLHIPATTPNWIIYFLNDRKQRDKMANDCFSEWGQCADRSTMHGAPNSANGYLP